jgi:ribosomal protein L15
MRHFHLTRNKHWRPTINVDKLWSLVPEEEKKDLNEDSEIVPVIDTLRHGYGKVLGNGRYVGYLTDYVRLTKSEKATEAAVHRQSAVRVGESRVSGSPVSLSAH